MRHLCDTNVFLASIVEAHTRHEIARAWVGALELPDTAEYCRATQNSILRLLTQKIAPGYQPVTNDQAIAVFTTLQTDSRIFLAVEPENLEGDWLKFAAADQAAPHRWMDAYLAAFARCSGMRFVTFDKGFRKFPGLDLLLLT